MTASTLRRLVLCALISGGFACGDSDPEPVDATTADADTSDAGTTDADTDLGLRDLGSVDTGATDAESPDSRHDGGQPKDAETTDADPADADPSDASEDDAAAEDAGEPDAEGADADVVDAEPTDAEPEDAEPIDADPVDAGVIDTGPADSGIVDTGPADTGIVDTGVADTGVADTGPPDTGPADSGTPDAGTVPPTCDPALGAAQACGGYPVGTWTYLSACVDPAVFAAARQSCPSLGVTQFGSTTSGTLVLNSNLSFTRNTTSVFVYEIIVPNLCRQAIGSCANVAVYIENSIPATQSVANCQTQGNGSCECALTVTQSSNDSGTYVPDSPNGILTVNGEEYYYCINGNGMLYKGTEDNASDSLVCNVLVR